MTFEHLLIESVTVLRETSVNDSYGDVTASTTSTAITEAALWQISGNESYISGSLREKSTHILVCDPDSYSWDVTLDRKIVHDSSTYRITGKPENVMNKDDILVVGLELIE